MLMKGFTLLEVLLASVISMVLIGIILQNYLSTKNIYTYQNELARFSEDIRFADFFLRQNIEHAGFAGCRRISELELANHTNMNFNSIYGYDSAHIPNDLRNTDMAAQTDIIVITKANSDITNLVTDVNINTAIINTKKNPATEANLFLLISDCNNGDLFTAKEHHTKIIHSKDALAHSYLAKNAIVSRFEELTFFIGKSKSLSSKNKPIYSLYFLVNKKDRQELIPEIKSMQIVYGVDMQGQNKVTTHLKANEITKLNLWNNVLSVEITLTPQNRLLKSKQWKTYIKLRERA